MSNMYKSKLNNTDSGGGTAVLLGNSGIDPSGSAPSATLQFVINGVFDYTYLLIENRGYRGSQIVHEFTILPTLPLAEGSAHMVCVDNRIEVDYGHYGTNTFTFWLNSTSNYPIKIYGININDILP